MFRMVFAIIAGYLTMEFLYGVLTARIIAAIPAWEAAPPVWYIVLNLLYGALFAGLGGFVAASIAAPPRLKAALILASLLVILGIVYLFQPSSGIQPWWYPWGLIMLGGPAAAGAGYLRVRCTKPRGAEVPAHEEGATT
jgi:hypothetical protein